MINATDRMICTGFVILIGLASIFAPCLPVRAAALLSFLIAATIAYGVRACQVVDGFLRRRYVKAASLAVPD